MSRRLLPRVMASSFVATSTSTRTSPPGEPPFRSLTVIGNVAVLGSSYCQEVAIRATVRRRVAEVVDADADNPRSLVHLYLSGFLEPVTRDHRTDVPHAPTHPRPRLGGLAS